MYYISILIKWKKCHIGKSEWVKFYILKWTYLYLIQICVFWNIAEHVEYYLLFGQNDGSFCECL